MLQTSLQNLSKQAKSGYERLLKAIEFLYLPLFLLLTFSIAYFCFYKLDTAAVQSFDEARHGINAYEMLNSKNWIVNTFLNENDYWNLKPPISYWCIMLSFKLFGYGTFALRFYSAFAYVLMAVVVGLFVKQYGKLASLFSLALLASNVLAFFSHMARTGDADSLYTMFFTFAMLSMLSIKKNRKMLYVCGLMFALAFLTKSWHAGMIVVISGCYLLLTGEIKKLKAKEWLLFVSSFAVPILLWVTARLIADGKTFFYWMVQQDLLNRTGSDFEGHDYPFLWYFENIFHSTYDYVYLPILIVCVIGCIVFSRIFVKEKVSDVLGYVLWILLPFLAFSMVSTKLLWYVYPTFIPLCIAAAIFLDKLLHSEEILRKVRFVFLLITLFFLCQNMQTSWEVVSSMTGDELQTVLTDSTADTLYHSANAYLQLAEVEGTDVLTKTAWSPDDDTRHKYQNLIFLAETGGDYQLADGGVDAFLSSSELGVLIASKVYYDADPEAFSECRILAESENYIAVGK